MFLTISSNLEADCLYTYRLSFVESTVSTFEDVDLGIEDLGVRGAVHGPVARSKMLRTESQQAPRLHVEID
jgi:hypothetical protein